MTALLIDSEALGVARDYALAGSANMAALALDELMKRSPTYEPSQSKTAGTATTNQTWYLRLLTGHDVRPLALDYAEASRMIEGLTTEGVTTHNEVIYRTTASADRMLAKKKRRATVPF